ncbi:MAG TPA: VIT and VWA domain-containing protein, partial [Nannocystaceae bacterium]|nr:VIT and VWA domain-containing protein [Nannocystaceae bacterium]
AARVTAFSYWNGAERILGEVLPKATARQVYDETVGRGRDPGLLEELAPGRFSLQVFPIEPRERKRVQIVWDQWLEQSGGEVVFRAPLADPRAELVIDLDDDRGIDHLRSSTHKLRIERKGGHLRVGATPGAKKAGEIVLRWHVDAEPMTMHGWVHRDRGDDGYVLLHVAAPPLDKSARVAKDVTIVVDESGSMEGEALANAKLAARAIVGRMDVHDRVNVVLFDDRVETLFSTPKPLTADVRAKAARFIDGAGNGGGTDIALAVQTAFAKQGDDERPKTVLLLTDGESPREPALAAAETDRVDVRLFTVGVGDQVDRPLLERLAAGHRGRYTAIATAAEIPTRMARLYARMRAPVFVGLELESEGPTLLRKYPETLPDLFAGDEIVISARVQGRGDLRVRLRGTTTLGPRTLETTLRIPDATERSWVGAQWARARIADLLTRLELEEIDRDERIDEVTRLGVAYDIVTPYTSFLAIPEAELTDRTRDMLVRGRSGDVSLGREIDMEEFRDIPVGDSTGRDFTGVVESSQAATSDSGGISLAGTTPAPTGGPPPPAKRAGCAHCSVDATTPVELVWLFVILVLRPRRRTHCAGAPASIHARTLATMPSSSSTGALSGMCDATLPLPSAGAHSESTR